MAAPTRDEPLVTINWQRLLPILRSFVITALGIMIGLWHTRVARGMPLFRDWAHVITAGTGGIIVQVLLEYTSAPPTAKNLRRRQLQNLIAGYAYGAAGTNVVETVQHIRLV